MMQLGFVSAILPELSLDEVLQVAAQIGYDCVEVMCWPKGKAERRYAGITHIDVADFGKAQVEEVHALTKRHGVSISGLGYYPNPLAADQQEAQAAVDQIHAVIEACQMLEIRQMNTFIGRDQALSVDENWPRFLETWKPIVDVAEKHDVRIGIENCPMFFTHDEWPGGKNLATTPAIWRRMFDAIPSERFGLNYDPSHLVWQQIDYVEPLWEFADHIFHVHAKDVRVDRHRLNQVGIMANPLEYHSPKLPGLGDVAWGRFVSVLGEIGYRGPVCVEVEDRVYEGTLESRKAALRQSHDYLRNFIPKASGQ
ncbi:MAG: sugar phosphate isomerase/epimerase family protein [Pirellulaceae bacterium]